MSEKTVDIAIVGGGAAGLTAALYAARAGRRVAVLDGGSGSQLFGAHKLENVPGFPPESGAAFIDRLQEQARAAGAELLYTEIDRIEKDEGGFLVSGNGAGVHARAVIIATGAAPRAGGALRESELVGRGVSYCALCDGRFFKGKPVAVIGGGNSAAEEALYLSSVASHVTLVLRRDRFRAEDRLVKELKASKNITIVYKRSVKSVEGESAVTGLVLVDPEGAEEQLPVSAVFFAVGRIASAPANLPNVMREGGFFRTDEHCRCLLADGVPYEGLYAAGDCRVTVLRQVVTGCADGAVAAVHASSFVQ